MVKLIEVIEISETLDHDEITVKTAKAKLRVYNYQFSTDEEKYRFLELLNQRWRARLLVRDTTSKKHYKGISSF